MAIKEKQAITKRGSKHFQSEKKKISLSSLKNWNLVLGALHAVQGLAVIVLSINRPFPVTISYLVKDPLLSSTSGHLVLANASRHLFDINLGYLVAVFFFISAVAHILVATVYRQRYETGLRKGINRVRWIEYALSASTMIVGIGLLVGIQDAPTLLLVFGVTAIMNLCGLAMEVYNQGKAKVTWLSYLIGCVAGVLPWLVIASYLLAGAVYGSSAPTFVYWIFISMFIFFSSFAVNMYLQYRRIKGWKDYLYGERVYMILSLLAKSLLAWQIFSGSLRP